MIVKRLEEAAAAKIKKDAEIAAAKTAMIAKA